MKRNELGARKIKLFSLELAIEKTVSTKTIKRLKMKRNELSARKNKTVQFRISN